MRHEYEVCVVVRFGGGGNDHVGAFLDAGKHLRVIVAGEPGHEVPAVDQIPEVGLWLQPGHEQINRNQPRRTASQQHGPGDFVRMVLPDCRAHSAQNDRRQKNRWQQAGQEIENKTCRRI